MSFAILWAIIAALGIPAGIIAGYFLRKSWAVREAQSAEAKGQAIIEEAKSKEREILIQAKDQALRVLDEAKKEEATRRAEIQHLQARIEKRETLFDQKLLELESKQKETTERGEKLEALKQEVIAIKEQQIQKLEKVAELSREDAKRVLMDNTEIRMKDELLARIRKLQAESDEDVEKQARNIIATAMQRVASSQSTESSTTVVDLPSEEMKGRIIGKEGRNIKTLENLTGIEIIVDETPESIVVSGFNGVRRHLAKRVLEKLLSDGRIHPARIEDTVEQVKKEMASDMKKAGDEAAYEVGVAGLDPRLLQVLGRLKYRTSYGQNQLRHSIEVGVLSVANA
jgi:ribonuclease Y